MKPITHQEPDEFRRMEAEDCTDCRQPTRTWLTPHVPLCESCAQKREAVMSDDTGKVLLTKEQAEFIAATIGLLTLTLANESRRNEETLRQEVYAKASRATDLLAINQEKGKE
jgi:hypothetical protein